LTVPVEGYDAQVITYAALAIIRAWDIERSAFGPVFGVAVRLHDRRDRSERCQ